MHFYVEKLHSKCVLSVEGDEKELHQTHTASLHDFLMLPDVVMLLDVDLVKHHVLLLGVNVIFHLHGNVARKY